VIPAAREHVLAGFDNRALVGQLADIYRAALSPDPPDLRWTI
jgi:hypothetical protein